MQSLSTHSKNDVRAPETPAAVFENEYTRLRRIEKRIYSDEELTRLPVIGAGHPHYGEWKSRRQSCKRLINYLKKKQSKRSVSLGQAEINPLLILEVGCGNGWLSHRLSELPGTRVTGLDINQTELDQASRVFAGIKGLKFIAGDICSSKIIEERFDLIIFAASIQYFPSFKDTIQQSLRLLNSGGEVHILDTHFYLPGELPEARRRTLEYYRQLGFAEMANHYFHRDINELSAFGYLFLYRPSSFHSFFYRSTNPFPWISIKNEIE